MLTELTNKIMTSEFLQENIRRFFSLNYKLFSVERIEYIQK